MPAQPLNIHLLTQRLDGQVLLAEPLLFPAVMLCHHDPAKLTSLVRELTLKSAEQLSPLDWHRHVLAAPPAIGRMELTVDPPRKQSAWGQPLACAFDYVWWTHGEEAAIAYFPALEIEVVTRGYKELLAAAPEHLRGALRRSAAIDSLYRIALLRRTQAIELSSAEVVADVRSPRQKHADAEAEDDKKKKPLIEQVGRVLSDDKELAAAYEVEPLVARLADALAGRVPRSVLLVGPAGVGKTAIVRDLVRRRGDFGLGQTPFWATSGARLVAGMSGFGMWQERCTKLCREASHARAVVHLGGLVELMEVGQAEMIAQGIAGFLKPFLMRGDLLAIAECTPEQLTLIERKDAHLLDAFAIIKVEELSAEQGRRIIEQCAAEWGKSLVRLSAAGLATLDRLHRRYAGYSAYPGRPLAFAQNLIHDVFSRHPDGFPSGQATLGESEVTAAFARQTGLPPFLLDDEVPLDLPAAQARFAGRVIGQSEAVALVTELIATVKAGLSRPRRPIASLLFIGPTGVGKTEMAKTLAEFFFGSADRMTRFDMSEFATAVDVQRLVGGVLGSEGLLTAKVREQPFAVVLLDEVEKAHPLLFDLLLQVLGEGRLTDAAGRVADFTNAVVVMTSNLGAESFQRGGFGLREVQTGPDARAHFTEEVRSFLRPELFNRIDRIVPFLPLDEATVERIVRREMELVARRDGILLRNVAFSPDEQLVRYLARKGYDRTYGARPLKRLIERELLVPLADGINGYGDNVKLAAEVTVRAEEPRPSGSGFSESEGHVDLVRPLPDGRGSLSVVVRAVGEQTGGLLAPAGGQWAEAANQASDPRRRIQRLHRSTVLLGAQNELFQLRRAEEIAREQAANEKKPPPYDAERAKRMARLTAAADGADESLARSIEIEDSALDHVYGAAAAPVPVAHHSDAESLSEGDRTRNSFSPSEWRATDVRRQTYDLSANVDELLLDVHDLRYPEPDRVTLALFGNRLWRLAELANVYLAIFAADAQVAGFSAHRNDKGEDELRSAKKVDELLRDPPNKTLGFVLSIGVRHAMARLAGEGGMHVFEKESKKEEVYVYAEQTAASQYRVPEPFLDGQHPRLPLRRSYNLDRAVAKDERTTGELRWAARGYRDAVEAGMAAAVRRLAEAVLDDGQAGEGQ